MLVLALSVTLNGYLLKGIAAPLVSKSGFVFRWDQSEAEKSMVVVAPSPTVPAPKQQQAMTFSADQMNVQRTIVIVPPYSPPALDDESESGKVQDADDRAKTRSLKELIDIFDNEKPLALTMLNDEEIIKLAQHGKIPAYNLEKVLGHHERAVRIRRALICEWNTSTVLC
jgi:hydroxymethylglutaryl-CoA reductase (NADPH)